MSDRTKAGTLFVREGTAVPGAVRFESEPYTSGWRIVLNLDGHGLGRQIHAAGWTFFCLAGEIRAMAFGMDGEKVVRRAIERILTKLKSECNSLEITRVASKRFLGVPYTSVSARSRHIQESMFLFRANDVQEWGRAKLAA